MKIKQLLSGVVAFAMLVTAMPVQAFAADDAGEATTWTKDLTVDELYHTVQDQLDENGTIALEDLAGIEAIASDVRDGVTGQLTAIMFDDQQVVLAEQDGSTSYTLTFAEENTADAAPAEPAAQPTAEPDAGESVTVPSEPAANDASTESQQTTGPPAQPGVSLTVTEEEVFTTEAEAEAKAQEQGVDPAAVSTETGADGQVLGATLKVNETEVSKVTLTYAANIQNTSNEIMLLKAPSNPSHEDSITLSVGESKTLTGNGSWYSNHSWDPSKNGVVSITSWGNQAEITANKVGTAKITHTYYSSWGGDKHTETWTVTVEKKTYGELRFDVYYLIGDRLPSPLYSNGEAVNYGPSQDDTPMCKVTVDIDKLLETYPNGIKTNYEQGGNQTWCITYDTCGETGNPERWWNNVLNCMDEASKEALQATGLANIFKGYVLKNQNQDGDYHLDGQLTVQPPVNVVELYLNTTGEDEYIGGAAVSEDAENQTTKEQLRTQYADKFQTEFGEGTIHWQAGNIYFQTADKYYRLTESAEPNQSITDNTYIQFTNKSNDLNVAQFFLTSEEMTVQYEPTKILIQKTDVEEKLLSGAQFGLYSDSSCETQIGEAVTTGDNGQAEFTVTGPGTYYVKETLAPGGYVLSDEVREVTVTAADEPTIKGNTVTFTLSVSPTQLTFVNKAKPTVQDVLNQFGKKAVAAENSTLPVDLNETFNFTLKQGDTKIATATATVTSSEPVALTSAENGTTKLDDGTYTLTEDDLSTEQTEAGWSKDLTSATITVDQNGNLIITVNGVAITSTPYTFINTYTAPVAKLSIEKKLLSVNGNQYTSGSVQSGNELTYQITVKNSGNADAEGPFNVTDSMWSGNGLLDSVKFTNANGQTSDSPVEVYSIEGGTVKVTAIPAHSQFIFTYHYIVQMSDEGKTLSNTVTLAKGESEVDQDTVEVPVVKTHCIVTYEYQSGTAGKSLPVDLLPAVPETQIFLVGDQMDKVPVPEKTTIETEDGTWQFRGWYSEGSLLNPPIRIEQDMHIIGLWNFTERQTATLTVNAVNENGDPFYALKNWPKTAEIEIDATYQISVAGNPEGGDVDVPEAITIGDVRYIYDSYGLNEGKLTGTMTKDGVSVDIVYAVDNVGGEDGKTPDDIPDRYQVTVRYDPIDPDQGSVSEPRIEVLTMKDYTDKLGTVTGSVWMSGATATAKSGYAFDYWTMWTSTTNEETNLSETSISTQENQIAAQTIPAVGGSTIAFTAYFKPVVTIDDVLEYFQKEFTVTSGLNEQAIFRFEIANANGQVITNLIQANTQRSGVAVPLQYTGDEKIILQPGTYTLYEVIPQDDASGIIYDQSRIQFIITEDAKILNKEGQALSDYTFKNSLSASSFTITKTVVDKDGKPADTIYQIGDTVYYQITVDSINTWPTGKTVKVFDQLPAGLALVSAESLDKSITIQSTENNTVVAEAAAKGTIRVTATVLESYDAAYDNIASVDDNDPTTTDDPKTDPVPIKVAALDVQKTLLDNSKVYNVGDTVQYQITFKNIGNVTLKEFDIADTVPNGLKIVDSAWEDGKFNDRLADELKPGEEKTVTVEVQITGYSTVYTNTATVTAKADKNTTIEQDATNDDLKVDAGVIQITPADITIYTGGNGYTGAVTGSATSTSSGLPEPGFYVTLPDALDDALKQAVGHEGDGPLDLSDYVTITAEASDGKDRTWTLERYDNQPDHESIAYDKYIYRIVPANGQAKVRVQFTDPENGNTIVPDDQFAIDLNELYKKYDMSINTGAVQADTVKIIVDANKDTDNFQAECAVDSGYGTLTVRGVVDEITTDIVNAVPENADNITAIASADTEYWINGSHLEVAPEHEVKLLVDEIVEDAQTALRNAIIASPENDFDDDFEFEFKYLDLVDTSNGNVWITPSQAMTVFWPYPNGTDEDTEFQVIHFVGLDRNYDDLEEKLEAKGAVDYLTDVEYHADGITFTVDSFSPFALVWEDDDDNGGGGAHHPEYDPDDEDDEDDEEEIIDDEVPLAETPWLNTEDHYAYIVGYAEDGTVRPNANITRAEVATIFFRLLTDEARDQFWMTTNNFSDVAADAWYNNAVSTMVNMGIIRGYEDGTFRPNANITRAEFAAIAARFMTSGYDVEDDLFIDIANHWAREDINDAAMAGWIHGYADDTFRPDAVITRAEAVTLVNNVLQRKPDADHMLDSMIKWPDNPEGAWYYEAIQEATNSHDYDLFEDAEYETWTALQENRDWAALEADWLNAHRTGGEVM